MNGERILVVEDDFLTALEIARILRKAGSEIVGPVGSLEDALSLAAAAVIDAAVLDINLDGHRVYDVAGVLTALHPFPACHWISTRRPSAGIAQRTRHEQAF